MKIRKSSAGMLFWIGTARKSAPLFTAFVAIIFAVSVLVVSGPCAAKHLTEKNIRLKTEQNTVLRDVLDDIFAQTGYKVVVSDSLAATPVVGVYEDVSIEDFLRRVFKKYNVSVIYDEKKQVAYVRSFGEDLKQNQTGAYLSVPREELVKESEEDSSAVDPLSGISLVELKRLQEQQLAEMERLRNDPDAVDPASGIPATELREKQALQQEQLMNRENDSEALDPASDIPLSSLREKQAQQLEQLKNRENDPEAVDPISGIPLKELREKQARQQEMLQQRTKDPKADPLMNISPSDLQ